VRQTLAGGQTTMVASCGAPNRCSSDVDSPSTELGAPSWSRLLSRP
jgi:hypothetical protein